MTSARSVKATAKATASTTHRQSNSQTVSESVIETRPDGSKTEHRKSVEVKVTEEVIRKLELEVSLEYVEAATVVTKQYVARHVPAVTEELMQTIFQNFKFHARSKPEHKFFAGADRPWSEMVQVHAERFVAIRANTPRPFGGLSRSDIASQSSASLKQQCLVYMKYVNHQAGYHIYSTKNIPFPKTVTRELLKAAKSYTRAGAPLSAKEQLFEANTLLPGDDAMSVHTMLRMIRCKGLAPEMRNWELLGIEYPLRDMPRYRPASFQVLQWEVFQPALDFSWIQPEDNSAIDTAECLWAQAKLLVPELHPSKPVVLDLPTRYVEYLAMHLQGGSKRDETVNCMKLLAAVLIQQSLLPRSDEEPCFQLGEARIPHRVLQRFPEQYRKADQGRRKVDAMMGRDQGELSGKNEHEEMWEEFLKMSVDNGTSSLEL